MVTPLAIGKLERIRVRLPPSRLFDELLGCTSRNRFFALYWSRRGHVPVLHDGALEIIGAVEPYRIWRYNPRVMAALAEYNTGDVYDHAEHWLLIDRELRVLYAGHAVDVLHVLGFQRRGVIDLLPEGEKPPFSAQARPAGLFDQPVAAKSFKKQMTVSLKLLQELDSWLARNLKGG